MGGLNWKIILDVKMENNFTEITEKKEGSRKKIVIWIAVVLALLALSLIFIFFIFFRQEAPKKEVLNETSVNPEVQISEMSEHIFRAYHEKNIGVCDEMPSEKEIISCKIQASSLLKDESFCSSNLENSNLSFSYITNPESIQNLRNLSTSNMTDLEIRYRIISQIDYIKLSFNDYCWLTLSLSKKTDYCSEILNAEAKEICLNKIKSKGAENES